MSRIFQQWRGWILRWHSTTLGLEFCCVLLLNWSFLEEMKNLKDFQAEKERPSNFFLRFAIRRQAKEVVIGPRVLECLPRNQKLEILSLNGMHVAESFWRSPSQEEGRQPPSRRGHRQGPAVVLTEEVPLATWIYCVDSRTWSVLVFDQSERCRRQSYSIHLKGNDVTRGTGSESLLPLDWLWNMWHWTWRRASFYSES